MNTTYTWDRIFSSLSPLFPTSYPSLSTWGYCFLHVTFCTVLEALDLKKIINELHLLKRKIGKSSYISSHFLLFLRFAIRFALVLFLIREFKLKRLSLMIIVLWHKHRRVEIKKLNFQINFYKNIGRGLLLELRVFEVPVYVQYFQCVRKYMWRMCVDVFVQH